MKLNGIDTDNGLGKLVLSESIDDDVSIDLPDSVAGFGTVQIGDTSPFEYATVFFRLDGTVVVESSSTNVANTDSDGNLCIFDNGTNIRISNRLGSTLTIRLYMRYSS